MNEYRVRRGRPIAGEISVPGDLAISRLAIAAAALANGPSILTGLLPAEQCRAMLDAITGRGSTVEFIDATDPDKLWQPPEDKPAAFPERVRITGIHMGSGAKGVIELLPQGTDREILLALLREGKTSIPFPPGHPDHALRVLRHFQIKAAVRDGHAVTYGGQMPESRDFRVPGDVSVAAQWITAAAMQPGSDFTIRGVGLNSTRTAFLRALVALGAQISEDIWPSRSGEITGTLIARGAPLHGAKFDAKLTAAFGETLPAVAVAASFAKGVSVFRLPYRLTREPMDRIVHHLRLLGVTVSTKDDGFDISGNALQPFLSGCLPSYGDPFLAMAFAVAGLFGEGETIVEDTACVEKTWAGFGETLRYFQSRAISDGIATPVINTWRTKAAPRSGAPQPQPTQPT